MATGQRPERTVGELSKPDLREVGRGELAFSLANLLQRRQPRIRTHEHHFKDGQRKDRVKSLSLRDIPWRMRQSVESILNLTRKRRNEPEHAPQESCLTGAVGAEQGEELPTFNGQREPF